VFVSGCVLAVAMAACSSSESAGPSGQALRILPDTVRLSSLDQATQLSLTGGEGSPQWTSSATAVVSVDQTGRVVAQGNGTATVTAQSGSGRATAHVVVEQVPAQLQFVSAIPVTVSASVFFEVAVEVADALGSRVPSFVGTVWFSAEPTSPTQESFGIPIKAGVSRYPYFFFAVGGVNRNVRVTAEGLPNLTSPEIVVEPQFVTLSADGDVTCANVGFDLGVFCWGSGDHDQLGIGSSMDALLPTRQPGTSLDRVDVGGGGGCGHAPDGTLYCWGTNEGGQLGRPGPAGAAVPLPVAMPGPWKGASAQEQRCAGIVDAANTSMELYCWGRGILGDGLPQRTEATPQKVASDERFLTVSVGREHVCALDTDRTAWCWGANTAGQLGTGDTTTRLEPVAVQWPAPWAQVVAGFRRTCGITMVGELLCWGSRSPVGDVSDRSLVPESLLPGVRVRELDLSNGEAGRSHGCAVGDEKGLFCWGSNFYGQLGDDSTTDSPVPVNIAPGTRFLYVVAGGRHSCASKQVQPGSPHTEVLCWGAGDRGQLGSGARVGSRIPVRMYSQVTR